MYRGTFSVIDLRAFADNLKYLSGLLDGDARLAVAVKANAYGHGIQRIMDVITKSDVVQVAVATLEEAIQIRGMGYDIPIIVFGALGPHELPIAAEHQIEVTYADTWGDWHALESLPSTLRVHTKVDTGMNRAGFKSLADVKAFVQWLQTRPDLQWQGIYTHLACSDAASDVHATRQIAQFAAWIDELKMSGYDVPLIHAANSGGLIRNSDWHFDMARVGIAAYGYSPDETVLSVPQLQSVMHVYSSILRIAIVHQGESVGYGATYTAQQTMRVATVSIGYADGYLRSLSNRGIMLLGDIEVPVIGRVCMDQLMLDITAVPDARVGDFVTVFGNAVPPAWTPEQWHNTLPANRENWLVTSFADANIGVGTRGVLSLSRIAALAETIPYEMVCQISPRVPKLYVE